MLDIPWDGDTQELWAQGAVGRAWGTSSQHQSLLSLASDQLGIQSTASQNTSGQIQLPCPNIWQPWKCLMAGPAPQHPHLAIPHTPQVTHSFMSIAHAGATLTTSRTIMA